MEMDNKYQGDESHNAKDEKWREEHRLGLINREISSGSKNFFWQCVFLFFTFAFCGICVFAINTGEGKGAEANTQGKTGIKNRYNFTHTWEYKDSGTMEYPSCSIGENFIPPSKNETSLVDFAFLSKMAYRSDDNAEKDMKEWFGNETKIEYFTNISTVIKEFEDSYKDPSNVVYKLFGFPNEIEPEKSVAILSIKGTDNGWDILADAQLWAGAAISQFVRSLIPLGSLFTPLLEDLIWFVSLIESKNLRNLSFYQKITALVNHLDKNTTFLDNDTTFKQKYPNLILTGHSLGGGLAMISGAQTNKTVIALSGPNALLSRRTFEPVITPEALKNYTFNIVPDRDPVPRIDDLSKNFQRIQCRTSANNFIGCHFGDQSICELLLSCGSEGRPIPCNCIEKGRDSNTRGDIFFERLTPVPGNNDDKNSTCRQ
ncbi:hypothetical protein CTEN210_12774 [Chaetoceros tenuissimus]|uniref:Fungal lipase-type domain-containing protein n=1 Tax=Chaetoceros tenuissimus TaxID=426638 RepID=A0AAD3HAU3_9STRA|nr:hypothetical protein CTEN210_12774 [Chaetoceros tenuissimus]